MHAKATDGDMVRTSRKRDGQIDMNALKPFPSWGEPTFDQLVTVRDANGKLMSYRVTEVGQSDERLPRGDFECR